MRKHVHPEIRLPLDTPERMVAAFREQRKTAVSEDQRNILDGLTEKWDKDGWHANTFKFLQTDGGGHGIRGENWDELYRRCVLA